MAENEGAAVAVDNAAVPTNEWERMLSGELYICGDMQREANMRKRRLVHAINTSAYDAFEERDRLFRELFGSLGKGAFLEPPFNCDYGCNTSSAPKKPDTALSLPVGDCSVAPMVAK